MQLTNLRGSLGVIDAFGFSLSIIAPTLAMAFAITLTRPGELHRWRI